VEKLRKKINPNHPNLAISGSKKGFLGLLGVSKKTPLRRIPSTSLKSENPCKS